MPVGLFTTQGLTIYNITEVGGSQTGTSSQFIISPNEGNIIFADRFTADTPTASDIYTSVSFVDTVGAGDPSNQVLVTINWNSTTTLTDSNTSDGDYIINLGITYDDTEVVTQAQLTEIYLKVQTDGNTNWGSNANMLVSQPSTSIAEYSQEGSDTVVNISGIVAATDPVLITQFTVTSNVGYYYFDDEYLIQSIVGQNPDLDSPGFTVEVTTNSQQDLFGNQTQHLYKVYYEATPDVDLDVNTVITVQAPQLVEYFANFEFNSLNVGSGSLNNHPISISTNIPGQFNLTFSDTWASSDTISSDGFIYVDVAALPGGTGSRSVNITLKDVAYNISRNLNAAGVSQPLALTQVADPAVSLTVMGSVLQDGKIISTPNTTFGQNVLDPPLLTSYDTNWVGDVVYTLYAAVDDNVSVSELNSGLVITQTQSFGVDWIVLSDSQGTWQELGAAGSGVWYRHFYIRNNESGADRTADFYFAHPDDASVNDRVNIYQDKYYDSSVDTVTTKTGYGQEGGVSGSSSYGAALTVSSNNQGFVNLKIKMSDYEGFGGTGSQSPFTLPNDSTTNVDQVDTFMQYPRPHIEIQAFGVADGITFDDLLTGSQVWLSYDTANMTFNTNYDPADSSNDHQYNMLISFNENGAFYSRLANIRVFHGQNNTSIADYTQTIIQPGINGLDAYQINDDDELTGNEEVDWLFYSAVGMTITIGIDSSGVNAPTIGLWDIDTSTYTALAAGVLSNGLSYSALVVIQGNYRKTNVTFTPNDPSGPRSVTLGFWVSTANPATDAPNDYITFYQVAESYDSSVYNVTLNYATGSQGINAPAAQTVVVDAFVQDYNQADYDADANEPDVDIVRVDFPGESPTVIPDDTGLIPSFTVAKNTNWPGDNSLATHKITIPFGVWAGTDPVYFQIKAKHEYNNTADYNYILDLQKLPAETLLFDGGLKYLVGDEFGSIYQDVQVGSEDIVTVLDADAILQPLLNTSFGADINSYQYPAPHEYIVARFIGASNNIIDVPSIIDGEPITDYNKIIYRNSENIQSYGFPYSNFQVPINLIPAGETNVVTRIGVWTGATAPKTNLINTTAGAWIDGAPGSITVTPVGTDGFNWSVADSTFEENSSGTKSYRFSMTDQHPNTEYAISFDVQNYEASDPTSPSTIGISTGWYNAPDNAGVTLEEVQANLRVSGNGQVRGLIKSFGGAINPIQYIKFFGRYNTNFEVRNIIVWNIRDDQKLRPAQSIAATPPSDVLKITSQGASAELSFGYDQFYGSPFVGAEADLLEQIESTEYFDGSMYPNCSSTAAVLNANVEGLYNFKINNSLEQNPVVKQWDGSNHYSLEGGFVQDTGGYQVDPSGMWNNKTLYIYNNNTGADRSIILGLYNGTPSAGQTPLDTYILTQRHIEG